MATERLHDLGGNFDVDEEIVWRIAATDKNTDGYVFWFDVGQLLELLSMRSKAGVQKALPPFLLARFLVVLRCETNIERPRRPLTATRRHRYLHPLT